MLAPNVMRPSNAVVLDPHARKRPKDKFSAVCISDPPAESILGQRTTPLIIRESCPHFPSQNAALKCVDALARLRGGEGWGKCPNAALEKATPPDLASPKIRPFAPFPKTGREKLITNASPCADPAHREGRRRADSRQAPSPRERWTGRTRCKA